jgi:hypothetical protein
VEEVEEEGGEGGGSHRLLMCHLSRRGMTRNPGTTRLLILNMILVIEETETRDIARDRDRDRDKECPEVAEMTVL